MHGNVQQGEGERQGPLTHSAYRDLCADAAWHGSPLPLWVQFQQQGLTRCGRIVEVQPGRGGPDWFQLDAGTSPLWVPHFRVRACQAAGLCHCAEGSRLEGMEQAAHAGERSEHGGAGCSVPLGNTGTTREAAV